MREHIKEKLLQIESLLNDPFNPYPLEEAFNSLLQDLKEVSKEEAYELYSWLNQIHKRLEENYKIALGWLEELAKREGKGEIVA